ncbi:P-loop containing nucleoside triphosphate hydrolase protein [Rhodofomes roseus]|uniref:ATP-dependent DNA helicase n=1 Tax=Rhodofomes roseus TaxID=34475 RepID=A0ABQ8KDR1_9APHY|nr:P-loop containing nucleoside triphosphate hydrolase protein [Rhodofomes roseus]KAH9835748.1 P-loop containing nucleoside triphosphate hydrolase protein [Rhodofomes roseus]
MSSDDAYFDDELDSAFLNEIDAIEAAHASPPKPAKPAAHLSSSRGPPSPAREVIDVEDSDPFDAFDFDVAVLQDIQEGRAREPEAGPSRAPMQRISSKNTIQTTLLGGIVQESTNSKPKSSTKAPMQRTHSARATLAERKTRRWDHTAFAKSGWRQSAEDKARKKGKGKASFNDAEEEEPVEFEQFPAPYVPVGPPRPNKLKPDLLAARHWIYPLNNPKRDYQFNIARHCLFENTLVALPTGLGKTFIAGVVMLNFYHWFPDGKVVFLAPTKPLVAQQIDASHRVCGIPGSHAAELTGETSRAKRVDAFAEKRVFYMTPQTLMSDLTSETCDPSDIILIVIDEAHKGSGDYAYAQVMRYMMAKNPHFRVLALTATPGSKPEAVQEIVNCLHISHIEIRDEESLDIRSYIHKKEVVKHVITMSEDINKLRELLCKIMQPLIKLVQSNGAMYGSTDPVMLHFFRCQSAVGELRMRKAPAWVTAAASKLQPLARAIGYLYEASTSMCYNVLNGVLSGHDNETGKQAASKNTQSGLQKDPNFQALIREIEAQRNRGFALHPKMEKLHALLVQHFAGHIGDREDANSRDGEEGAGDAEESRVMVFASFRECVDELVEILNKESPLIRAARFIGQAADKNGRSGLAQREQLEVIKKFKAGEFNVLVSTSIGEEGLDIGEVDMIVCYDSQKTPIRMLQRAGRTGRKRAGVVHVLIAEGREDRNWERAKGKYKDVQDYIVKADELELYADVERLLPDHVKPVCVERVMEIEEYVREEKTSRKGSRADGGGSPKGKKRRRSDDPLHNVPAGASNGFVNVKDLLVKGAKGRKKRKVDVDPEKYTGEDDDDDLEIEAGVFAPRRAASTSAVSRANNTRKLRRVKTVASTDSAEKPKKRKKAVHPPELTESQIARMAADDSDDADIERGLASSSTTLCSANETLRSTSRRARDTSPVVLADRSIIDLTTPSQPTRTMSPAISLSSSPDRPLVRLGKKAGGRRCGTTPSPDPSPSTSSPERPLKSRSTSTLSRTRQPHQSASPPALTVNHSSGSPALDVAPKDGDMAWLIDDDEDPDIQVVKSSPVLHRNLSPVISSDDELDLFRERFNSPSPANGKDASLASVNPVSGTVTKQRELMPPPALPARLTRPHEAEPMPEPTFAVRAPGVQNRRQAVIDLSDSSPLAMPPPSQRRLRRQRSSPSPPSPPSPAPHRPKKRKFKDIVEAQKANPWMDVEATHSGDERSVGSSDVENEDGYEPSFVQDALETQVSPSYDQSAVYRRSLLTQAPGGSRAAPVFANRPTARGWGAYGGASASRVVSNSSRYESEDDEYEFGSFVVDDDEDLATHSSSEP